MKNIEGGVRVEAQQHKSHLHKVISGIASKISSAFLGKTYKSFDEIETEWYSIGKVVEILKQQEDQVDISRSSVHTLSTLQIEAKPYVIEGEDFTKRHFACLDIFDRIEKIYSISKKKFNKHLKTIPATSDTILAKDHFDAAMKRVSNILYKEINFDLIKEHVGVRYITNPKKLIDVFGELLVIIYHTFDDDYVKRVMKVTPVVKK